MIMYTATIMAWVDPINMSNADFFSLVGAVEYPVIRMIHGSRESTAPGVLPRKKKSGKLFRSAVEFDISKRFGDQEEERIYKVKMFPVSGTITIPGVVMEDLSDGLWVTKVLVSELQSRTGLTMRLKRLETAQSKVLYSVIIANFKTVLQLSAHERLNTLRLEKVLKSLPPSYNILEVHYGGGRNREVRFKIVKLDIDPDSMWENLRKLENSGNVRMRPLLPRVTTVIIYPSSKINIQNGISPSFSRQVLGLIESIISDHRSDVIITTATQPTEGRLCV